MCLAYNKCLGLKYEKSSCQQQIRWQVFQCNFMKLFVTLEKIIENWKNVSNEIQYLLLENNACKDQQSIPSTSKKYS